MKISTIIITIWTVLMFDKTSIASASSFISSKSNQHESFSWSTQNSGVLTSVDNLKQPTTLAPSNTFTTMSEGSTSIIGPSESTIDNSLDNSGIVTTPVTISEQLSTYRSETILQKFSTQSKLHSTFSNTLPVSDSSIIISTISDQFNPLSSLTIKNLPSLTTEVSFSTPAMASLMNQESSSQILTHYTQSLSSNIDVSSQSSGTQSLSSNIDVSSQASGTQFLSSNIDVSSQSRGTQFLSSNIDVSSQASGTPSLSSNIDVSSQSRGTQSKTLSENSPNLSSSTTSIQYPDSSSFSTQMQLSSVITSNIIVDSITFTKTESLTKTSTPLIENVSIFSSMVNESVSTVTYLPRFTASQSNFLETKSSIMEESDIQSSQASEIVSSSNFDSSFIISSQLNLISTDTSSSVFTSSKMISEFIENSETLLYSSLETSSSSFSNLPLSSNYEAFESITLLTELVQASASLFTVSVDVSLSSIRSSIDIEQSHTLQKTPVFSTFYTQLLSTVSTNKISSSISSVGKSSMIPSQMKSSEALATLTLISNMYSSINTNVLNSFSTSETTSTNVASIQQSDSILVSHDSSLPTTSKRAEHSTFVLGGSSSSSLLQSSKKVMDFSSNISPEVSSFKVDLEPSSTLILIEPTSFVHNIPTSAVFESSEKSIESQSPATTTRVNLHQTSSSQIIVLISSSSIKTSTSIPVQILPSALPVNNDKLTKMVLRIPQNVDVSTEDFKRKTTQSLQAVYNQGKTNRKRKRRNIANDVVVVKSITRQPSNPEDVDVRFYIEENGSILPTQQVMSIFNKVPTSDVDKEMGYTVLRIESVQQTTTSDDEIAPWIIVVAVLAPIVLLLTIVLLVSCYRNKALRKIQLHPLVEDEPQLYKEGLNQKILTPREQKYTDDNPPKTLPPILSPNYKVNNKKKKMPAADRFEQFVEREEEEILHFVPKMNKKNFKANSLVKPLQPNKSIAAEIEDLTRGCKKFQANPMSKNVGVRLHADILSPPSSNRSLADGQASTHLGMSSPLHHSRFDSPGGLTSSLGDSPEHLRIMEKISALQLTVDSLQGKRGTKSESVNERKSVSQSTVLNEADEKPDISRIRNKERIRKREEAKAKRRLKRNEVIELNDMQNHAINDEDETAEHLPDMNLDGEDYKKKKDAVNKLLKKKRKMKKSGKIVPSLHSTDTESPRSMCTSDENDEKPLFKQSRKQRFYNQPEDMSPFQGRLPPLHYPNPYMPGVGVFPPHPMSGPYPSMVPTFYASPTMHDGYHQPPNMFTSPWGRLPQSRIRGLEPRIEQLSPDSTESNNNEDLSSSSAGMVLPNGRGQPRKKIRHVTEHDIESLERAQASARAKLKTVLDKASEDARELLQSSGKESSIT
ncbi:serine-rich adhesin for platelets-like [Clytia hemisphaerica]|uniref:Uncharacterized protein n=1 Tax=Clytia hemisphaerica TaxID=252671 RepID=A0A7M5X631_9CNID